MDLAIKTNTCFLPNLKSQEGEINRQNYTYIHKYTTHGGWDSVVSINNSLQAGWCGVQAWVEARLSTLIQTSPEAHPASCTVGIGSPSQG